LNQRTRPRVGDTCCRYHTSVTSPVAPEREDGADVTIVQPPCSSLP